MFRDRLFFTYLVLTVLGLHCCAGFSVVLENGGYSLVVVRGLLTVGASFVAEHGLSSSSACAIFLDKGMNLCPLHCQVDSY